MNCEKLIREHGISNKTIWGPIYWKFIILNIFNSKETIENNYIKVGLHTLNINGMEDMILGVLMLIPCDECQKHFAENLDKFLLGKELTKSNLIFTIVSTYNNIERSNGRRDDRTRDNLVDKYLGDELNRAVKICNG